MKNSFGKHFGLWRTLGFLGLLVAMFFSYHFISAGTSAGEVVEISVDGYQTITNGAPSQYTVQSDKTEHYHGKFRHTVRKRGLSRTNYLKRTVQYVSSWDEQQTITAGHAFLGYAWLYHRPSYYVHLFLYALF